MGYSTLSPPSFPLSLYQLTCWEVTLSYRALKESFHTYGRSNNLAVMGSTPCYCWECGDGQGSRVLPWCSVCVRQQEKKTVSAFECPVQRACIINEITLADGSDLGTPPPPTTTEICSWLTCTHILYFSSLVKCASDCLSLLFLVLFTLCIPLILSFSLRPLLCARLLFVKRFDLGSQAFQAKTTALLLPHIHIISPTLFPSIRSSTHTERFVHTSSKTPLFQADYLWLAVWKNKNLFML